jgi:DNA-binding LacI/PurR family transcriptional regulator
MDKQILEELKLGLRYGDNNEVARRTGLGVSTVSNHLNGHVKYPSKLIIDTALQIIADRKRQEKATARKIKNIVNA